MAVVDPVSGRTVPEQGAIDQVFLDHASTPDSFRMSRYSLYESYYTGEISEPGTSRRIPMITDRLRRYLARSGLVFNENFCDTVVDVIAERLTVTGFLVTGTTDERKAKPAAAPVPVSPPVATGTAPNGATAAPVAPPVPAPDPGEEAAGEIAEWIDQLWDWNHLDVGQDTVHTTVIEKGDAIIMVDWDADKKRPCLYFNKPESFPHIVYDEDNPGMIAWASKCWYTRRKSDLNKDGKAIERLNVYYPDRIERYYRLAADGGSRGGWAFYTVDAGAIVPWVTEGNQPRGVPIFHFRWKPLGAEYGRSELHAVIPFQDELNKFVIDLAETMDYQGWPQRFGTGFDKKNADLKPQPGSMFHSPDEKAAFGQFASADPKGPLEVIEGTLSRLARRSRIPMHLMTGGTPPSGESLKTAESGLVKKAEKAQIALADVWEAAVLMCLGLAVDNKTLSLPVPLDDLNLEAQWETAQTRNDLGVAQEMEVWDALGVSKHTIFGRLGVDYEKEMEYAAQEKATLEQIGSDLLNAGGLDVVPPTDITPAAIAIQTPTLKPRGPMGKIG